MMEQLKELRAADDAAYEFWNAEYKFFSDVYQFITGKAWTSDTPKSEKVNNVKAFLLR